MNRGESGCAHEHDDGPYVLGALSPEDRLAFERHLPGCATCSASVRELAGLPGLLTRVPAEVLESAGPAAPVPDTLLPGLVRRARRAERRRRTRVLATTAAAVVAAVAVVAVGVGALAGQDDDVPSAAGEPSAGASTAAPRPLAPVGAEPISGWVSLTPVAWGTRLDLTCSYAEEAYFSDPAYVLYVTRDDGRTERVASWRALPGRTMHLTAATSADPADIADVLVRTTSGRTVLRLPASGPQGN